MLITEIGNFLLGITLKVVKMFIDSSLHLLELVRGELARGIIDHGLQV